MLFAIHIVQIVLAALLIAAILLQQRGGGLSTTFGGEGKIYHTRRGMEKTIFQATIILSALFFLLAIVNIVYQQQNVGDMQNMGATASSTAPSTTAPISPGAINAPSVMPDAAVPDVPKEQPLM